MFRTRVKICGITRREDALAAIDAGADAIGLVFYPASKRCVSIEQAQDIVTGLPALVTVVGLFVNAQAAEVKAACQQLPLGLLQFHGDEAASFCEQFGRPWMKALRVAQETDITAAGAAFTRADAMLLDTYVDGLPGGTGERFDWHKVPKTSERPLVLAGGLRADNVAEAIAVAEPYAVDVSGGVEDQPGIKSRTLLKEFMAAVAAADERRRLR